MGDGAASEDGAVERGASSGSKHCSGLAAVTYFDSSGGSRIGDALALGVVLERENAGQMQFALHV